MPVVRFNYAEISLISLKGKNVLKELILEIFISEAKILNSLTYVFCLDNFLLEINRQFLHHDYFTDVISFDLSEGEAIIGEIYISIDRVKENAISNHFSFKEELSRVIIHGALHLCGYKDKKKSEITMMRKKEDYYLYLLSQKYK